MWATSTFKCGSPIKANEKEKTIDTHTHKKKIINDAVSELKKNDKLKGISRKGQLMNRETESPEHVWLEHMYVCGEMKSRSRSAPPPPLACHVCVHVGVSRAAEMTHAQIETFWTLDLKILTDGTHTHTHTAVTDQWGGTSHERTEGRGVSPDSQPNSTGCGQ